MITALALAPLACVRNAQPPTSPAPETTASAAPATPQEKCPLGIIHWWEPDLEKGVAVDAISGRQGAPRGDPTLSPRTESSQAFAFDGSDDYVEIQSMSLKALEPTRALTVAAWIKTTPTGRLRAIVGKISAQEPRSGYLLSIDEGGRVRCDLGSDSQARRFATVLSGTALADDGWHHVACTFSGVDARVFIDGVSRGGMPYSASLGTHTEPLLIGKDSFRLGSRHFPGLIDDVVLFNRALSAEELERLMKLSPDACRAGDRP
ncbi:LamG domain-containing protein [Hyalangium rubrum]|uniref:LamG domain-containing protein n=1 Tax=Hyalangium rubrum TaxID=3103134 RepID=A0ABU5H0G1_9BACT|nr:LamG domain-containing protein [Hyalangium sp. s54d21]MDY7225595.1 LamG domain-containing protein [Hyalangium sp. s54d21]